MAIRNAGVQAKNVATGVLFRALSAVSGDYGITKLPAGQYVVTVNMPCCAYDGYTKEDVVVKTAQNVKLDIRLAEGVSFRTLGDDPGLNSDIIRARAKVRNKPAPRMASGKPDLSGTWQSNDDVFPADPELLPWADAIVKERIANNFKDSPTGRCLPGGPIVGGPYLIKLVQTPALLVEMFEDFVGFRQVFLDGRAHPKTMNPSWYGHATGKWENDTLVIDAVGFNDRATINLFPVTEQLHLTERYHRRDLGHMDVVITVDDPGTFKKPWKLTMIWTRAPGEEIGEYVCEEGNRDAAHLVGK